MQEQTIFDIIYPKYKINKPIRLIELFGGYGSQALALKYLGVKFQHWKLCEWAVKSIQAYKDIHFSYDDNDYSASFDLEFIKKFLLDKGISQNYNEPLGEKQIEKMSEHYARQVFNNIIATHNLVNIQQVKGRDLEISNTDKYDYILTYSFPCQDLSLAGKGKGMSDTSTRSGLLWEVERILTELTEKPQILLMENVPQVHSEDNKKDFLKWINRLEELGYKNYFQDLIATDYGIPQTRNRCFMISILGDYSYTFPPKQKLQLKLKDMLEDNVDGKYFLSDKAIKGLQNQMDKEHKPTIIDTKKEPNKSFSTITAGYRKQGHYETYLVDQKYYLSDKMKDYIVSKDDKYKVNENKLVINRDIACSKTTREGNTRADTSDYICKELPSNTNILKIKNATSKGYLEAEVGDGIDISSRMEHHRGTVQKGKAQTITTMGGENVGVVVDTKNNLHKSLKETLLTNTIENGINYIDSYNKTIDNSGISKTLTTRVDASNNTYIAINEPKIIDDRDKGINGIRTESNCPTQRATRNCLKVLQSDLKIRKLTPRECFRLMGVKDEDFDKCAKNQSDGSLYHLAGDSIVVNVLMAIFKELYDKE